MGLGVEVLDSTGWPGGNGIGGEGSLISVAGPSILGPSVLPRGDNGVGGSTTSPAEDVFASTG